MARSVRVVDPDCYYFITNRCLEGRFLMRPDAECRRIIKGCLARAAETHNVEIVCFVFMSNHFHLIVRFPDMNMSEFMEEFQSQIASRINKHRGRRGVFFPERFDDQALLDDQVLLDKIRYVLNNPVKDGLVTRAEDWPGVTSMDCHTSGDAFEGKWLNGRRWTNLKRRKDEYPREDAMDTHRVDLHLPEALDGQTEAERRSALLQLVEDDRKRLWAESTGRQDRPPRALGREEILAVSWNSSPEEPPCAPFKRRRLCIASEPSVISAYRERRRQIDRAYREASSAWRRREAVEFPVGTYPPGWRHCVGSPADE